MGSILINSMNTLIKLICIVADVKMFKRLICFFYKVVNLAVFRSFCVRNLCCHCDVSVGTNCGGTPAGTAGQEAASELVATSDLSLIRFIVLLEHNQGKLHFSRRLYFSAAVMVSGGV